MSFHHLREVTVTDPQIRVGISDSCKARHIGAAHGSMLLRTEPTYYFRELINFNTAYDSQRPRLSLYSVCLASFHVLRCRSGRRNKCLVGELQLWFLW